MGYVARNTERQDFARSRGYARSLGWGFAGLVGVTLCLIVLGALVRAHGAGLACPDWPLCFGKAIPRFDFRIAYEWSHRVLASLVSLGLLGLSALLVQARPLPRHIGIPLVAAWAILGVQILLGALTVWLKLAPWTVTAHLIVGLSFCAMLLWISRELFETHARPERTPVPAAARLLGGVSGALLIGQILLGGLVSSQFAGLACSSFPTCDGSSFAPSLSGLVGLHVFHRMNGVLLLLSLLAFAWTARAHRRAYRFAFLAVRLVLFQIGIGVLNVLLQLAVEVTALHTGLAAGIALVLCLALRELVRSPSPEVDATGRSGAARERASDLEAPQIA